MRKLYIIIGIMNKYILLLHAMHICVYRVKERELEPGSADVTAGIRGSYVTTVKTTITKQRKMIHIPLV